MNNQSPVAVANTAWPFSGNLKDSPRQLACPRLGNGGRGYFMNDYETKLAEWKARHGLDLTRETNQDEMRMAAEEAQARGKSWCFGCDRHMLIREMKLITRAIDAYVQIDENEGDYIAKSNRVRMCPKCFDEKYERGEV